MNFVQTVRGNAIGEQGTFVVGRNGIQQIFRGAVGTINGDNYGDVISINGSSISGFSRGKEVKEAAELKVIALDGDGKEMESFRLPTGTHLEIHVNAPTIENIQSTTGDVKVEQAKKVGRINTSTGRVQIDKVDKVGGVNTTTGSVTVLECAKMGSVNTTTGNIQINKARRDSSPKRK